MKKTLISGAVGAAILAGGALQAVQAAPIVVSGNFIQLKVSDDGTIGDGNSLPALIYDPTGTGTFDPNTDYVAPGIPFEAFGFRSDQTGSSPIANSNDNFNGGGSIGGDDAFNMNSLADLSGGAFDHHIRWTGTSQDGLVGIQHDFFFASNSERINLQTIITALTENLTGVRFSRAVDPDPDNVPGGSADTAN
ncbi:MAG: hypothetical protein M3Z21_13110, partial [Pseudomonadota bacterium]|nr:hypothetical protein [Pseudomonadota bacterium]